MRDGERRVEGAKGIERGGDIYGRNETNDSLECLFMDRHKFRDRLFA